MFLSDQSILMTLAREAITLHALPVTGIPSSIGTLNPPFSVYLLVPFVALGRNPWPVVMSVAVWNVVGIGLTYVWALRHFGQRVAAVSALLFATCGAAVDYSRYLWQQNYLAPFLALFGVALFSWCVRGNRGWFPLAVLMLLVAALLHPTALLLAPLLGVALVLAPVRPDRWEWGIAIVGVAVLLAPTIIWEALTNGSDFQALGQLVHERPHVDLAALACLYEVLGRPGTVTGFPVAPDGTLASLRTLLLTPPHTIFRAGAFYNLLGRRGATLIPLAAFGLFLVGWLILTACTLSPLLPWRRRQSDSGEEHSGPPLEADRHLWERVRSNPAWRGRVLLWLWLTVPPLALIRHTSPVYPHYLIILYPAAFVASALGFDWLFRQATGLVRTFVHSERPSSRVWGVLSSGALVSLLALLLVGQAVQAGLFVASLGAAQFDGPSFDSLPLRALNAADATLVRLQHRVGARTVFVLTQPSRDAALTYMLVADHRDHVRVPDDCLVLPAPASNASLVVSSRASSDATQLLTQLPTSSHVGDIPLPGGEPLQVFRVAAPPASLPGEHRAGPQVFRDAAGVGLSLEGVARAGPGLLRLRWRVLASTPAGLSQTAFRITLAASGVAATAADTVECQATAWEAGETLFTWLPIPASSTSGVPPIAAVAGAGAVTVSIQEQTTMPGIHWAGPLRVLAFSDVVTHVTRLSPRGR